MKKPTSIALLASVVVISVLAGPIQANSRDRRPLDVAISPSISTLPEIDPLDSSLDPDAGSSSPSIAGLGEMTPDQARALAAADGEFEHALGLVARFLELRPEQLEALVGLLRERRQAVVPILREIGTREQMLHRLIDAGENPAAIGHLVLEIKGLYEQIGVVQQRFLSTFGHLLDAQQLERFEAIVLAARLNELLPAFKLLSLI